MVPVVEGPAAVEEAVVVAAAEKLPWAVAVAAVVVAA